MNNSTDMLVYKRAVCFYPKTCQVPEQLEAIGNQKKIKEKQFNCLKKPSTC